MSNDAAWAPSATPALLQQRAQVLAAARRFMAERSILEVETPALCEHTTTDPWIESLPVTAAGRTHWLRTSPEHHMKRLLAGGAPDIYQLGKVFRNDPSAARHQPEFTLLEWYRHGFDDQAMMEETCELLHALAQTTGTELAAPEHLSYSTALQNATGINPLQTSVGELTERARELHGWREALADELGSAPEPWLDLLFSHAVVPALPGNRLVVIYDYPAAQALLARTQPHDPRVAARFEVLLNGLELANGYLELRDPREQRRRAELDNVRRRALRAPPVAVDEKLLQALEHGLPDCAGVAVGIDRTLMALTRAAHINSVLSFAAGT